MRPATGARALGPLALLALAGAACEKPSRPATPLSIASAPAAPVVARAREATGTLELSREPARVLLCQVLAERDRDCDRRITIDDEKRLPARSAPAFPFAVEVEGQTITLGARNEAAQLVTELVRRLKAQEPRVALDLSRVHADPVSYLEGRVRSAFWDALTRRIDADPKGLARAASDEKLDDSSHDDEELCPELAAHCGDAPTEPAQANAKARTLYVYYPKSDDAAREVFEHAAVPGQIAVLPLPEHVTPAWVAARTQRHEHGLLTLALGPDGVGRPFVVPGGRFNEMYGWDSFFITWGLLEDPARLELARSMVENHAYEIERYGKILNANRTYYLTRSQPPFFTSMLRRVWQRMPHDEAGRAWLTQNLDAALREYREVWSKPPRRFSPCEGDVCLARYFGEGRGEPPEVEPGAFDWFYQAHAVAHAHCKAPGPGPDERGAFVACAAGVAEAYRSGQLRDAAIDAFFSNDRCVRESGHDTTFRWFSGGSEHCADYATVDLNALLFKIETDLATLVAQEFGGRFEQETTAALCRRAQARARLVKKYLWDPERGLFFDYDARAKRRSGYVAATTLYPLFASTKSACDASLVSGDMARTLRDRALAELEAPGGLEATAPSSLARVELPAVWRRTSAGGVERIAPGRQWEAPNGWAPHQMLAWEGLRRAGFADDAERLAYRWLYTIVKNAADYHGTVPEKYDVERRSHAVFQEYGNVNTDFSYIAEEGFGWMNASFLVGLDELRPKLRDELRALTPPEALFPAR